MTGEPRRRADRGPADRRAVRRRQIRRRRAAALAVMGALVLTVALIAFRGGSPSSASGSEPNPLGSGSPVTLAFGGDVHFESPIRERVAANPASVMAGVAPALNEADIAMVNIETAITDGGTPAPKSFVFRAPPRSLAAVTSGGVDLITMANNHGMDYGVGGLQDSIAAAAEASLPLVGAGADDAAAYAPYRVTVKGQRIAIIGATQVLDDNLIDAWTAGPGKPGLASAKEEERLERAVREARADSDTVVVYVHWGRELETCPTTTQQSLAARLVGAGADVVVGGHAHVLQGAGRMGDGFVAYGLGNFVFYAKRDIARQSGVLQVTVTGRRIDGYRWVPARITDGVPTTLTGDAATTAQAQWDDLRACTGLTP